MAEAVRTTWYATSSSSVSPGGVSGLSCPSRGERSQLTWIDRQGEPSARSDHRARTLGFIVTGWKARGRQGSDGGSGDLWTLDLSSDQRTRLTFRREIYSPGVWSPDGARIAYSAGSLGDTIYEKASSGVGEATELLKEPGLRHSPPAGRPTVDSCCTTPRTRQRQDTTCGCYLSTVIASRFCYSEIPTTSGPASSRRICAGLLMYPWRPVEYTPTFMFARSASQSRPASRRSARASGRLRRAVETGPLAQPQGDHL